MMNELNADGKTGCAVKDKRLLETEVKGLIIIHHQIPKHPMNQLRRADGWMALNKWLTESL